MENYCRLRPDHQGMVGTGVKFQRIRRVTGYLVGTLDRFNDAKRAEEHDRVKHMHVQLKITLLLSYLKINSTISSCVPHLFSGVVFFLECVKRADYKHPSGLNYLCAVL